MASPRPVITSFTPAAAIGGAIRITGRHLAGTTAITVGGTAVDRFSLAADGLLTAVIATGTTTGRVAITTPDGTTVSRDPLAILTDAPSIDRFAPNSGKAGDVIALTGAHFTGVSGVTIGGVPAGSIPQSDTLLLVIVPPAAITGTVHVTGPGGTGVSGGTFTYVPTPTIESSTPERAGAGTLIAIHGSGFTAASAVTIGGTPAASFTVNGDTSITATLGAGASGHIAVTNSHGTGTSLDTLLFLESPTITSFLPTEGPPGSEVTITGTHLEDARTVRFDGKQATSIDPISPTSVSAVVPRDATTGHIAVTTPGGTVTSSGTFTVGEGPEIDYVTPLFAQIGDTITVKGYKLTGATSVKVGGVSCTGVVVGSDSSLTATIGAATPTGKAAVTTPDGTTVSDQSIAIQAAPTVSSLSPSSGAVGAAVLITGTGFAGITGVSFNGTPAAFAVLSPTRIRATVPSGATTGTITVANAAGTGTSSTFTVL